MATKTAIPKTRVFNGHKYELAGSGRIEGSKAAIERWADFQRKTNGLGVRVIKVPGGYVGYLCYTTAGHKKMRANMKRYAHTHGLS